MLCRIRRFLSGLIIALWAACTGYVLYAIHDPSQKSALLTNSLITLVFLIILWIARVFVTYLKNKLSS